MFYIISRLCILLDTVYKFYVNNEYTALHKGQ